MASSSCNGMAADARPSIARWENGFCFEMNTDNHRLRVGVLGPLQIAFFVISAAGPLVAMAGGIPITMLLGNGPGTPALFLFASLILIAFSVGYTDMARDIRNAGAFYVFTAKGFGGVASGAAGFVAIVSYNALQIGLYGLFGVAASSLVASLTNIVLPWQLYAFAAMGVISVLGYRQVDLSAKILGVLVTLEYFVVLILCVMIVLSGGHDGLSARPFAPSVVVEGAPAIGLMFCFAAFVGFEATTIYSEEARNPERSIPTATYFAVLLIGGFYTFCTWSVVMGAGVDDLWSLLRGLPDPTELLFTLSNNFAGSWLSLLMRMLFVTSIFASLLAFHNAIARYMFVMGRERLLPEPLGRTHAKYYSPHIGSLTQSLCAFVAICAFALTGADPILIVFTLPSAIGVLGIITLMAFVSAAVIRYLLKHRTTRINVVITAFAFVALTAAAILAALKFNLLAGSETTAAGLLPLTLLAAFIIGGFFAFDLRRRDPNAFRNIGGK